MKSNVLLIGSDGFLGARFFFGFQQSGWNVIGTTRRRERVKGGGLFLDLLEQRRFAIPEGIKFAVLAAGITSFEKCEKGSEAEKVNVEATVALSLCLLNAGVFLVFLSSSSVFGGVHEFPDEDAAVSPTTRYAQQKTEVEKRLAKEAEKMSAADRLAVVRITKVLAPEARPVSSWHDAWAENHAARPFSDLACSPVTPDYVVAGIMAILQRRAQGIYHLSGEGEVSYACLCLRLADSLGLPDSSVRPTTSVGTGIALLHSPRNCALGMRGTTQTLGIVPQPLSAVIECLGHGRQPPP